VVDDRLLEVLERSREHGLLGPASVEDHVGHAKGFAAGLDQQPARFLDLGSGGGVPGLVLACLWSDATAVLLDASERSSDILRDAVARLSLSKRVTVLRARAEEAGRRDDLRASCDVVVARSFGPAAVTAECGAPFLQSGGWLIVSEPPGGAARWPAVGLSMLGLALGPAWRTPFSYQALVQRAPCPDRYPRRVGIPNKRPLF
jgi:16S rRNA (guanine527-N7)-methyltransferase